VYIRVQPAQQSADREEVFRFRYRVQAAESGQAPADADHARGWIRDELDDHARILVAVDDSTGAVLGTLRALLGCDQPFSAALSDSLDLSSMIVAFGEERLCHSSMFMVDPAYRGQTVASQLVAGLVSLMLEHGIDIDVCRVEMAQARSWFQLGYRPYGPLVQPPGRDELQVPLALVLRDRAYLEQTGSPLTRQLGPVDLDRGVVAQRLRELYPHFEDQLVTPQRLGAFWASVAHAAGAARSASIFDGIDQERLDPILRELPTLRVSADRPVGPGGQHGEGLGLILRGRLGLTMEQGERPFFVSVLQPGEVFGTLDEIPSTPPDARLLALEDTELLVLPPELIARLELQSPGLVQRLRHNLGGIVASRLDATHRQVAGFMRGSPERIPVLMGGDKPGGEPGPSLEHTHPTIIGAEQLEAELLARVPFSPGTLLDPCAGTGLGTRLLAQQHPQARVVGVEPDPQRRARAEALAQRQGMADHCTYIAGEPARLPLEPDTVDGAYLRLALHRQADPVAVLRELSRVMRPGGVIAVLALDDGGLMVHPEPSGFPDLQGAMARLQRQLGGDRRIGRRLPGLLADAGLDLLGCDLIPLTPANLPLDDLLSLVFEPRVQLLRSSGVLTPQLDDTLGQLLGLAQHPDAWMCAPVMLAWAEQPAAEPLF